MHDDMINVFEKGWMVGWMDRRMDEWMDGYIDRWMYGMTDRLIA